jgi:hypothetical protein
MIMMNMSDDEAFDPRNRKVDIVAISRIRPLKRSTVDEDRTVFVQENLMARARDSSIRTVVYDMHER